MSLVKAAEDGKAQGALWTLQPTILLARNGETIFRRARSTFETKPTLAYASLITMRKCGRTSTPTEQGVFSRSQELARLPSMRAIAWY